MQKNSYNYDELISCGEGKLFGEGNAKLPLPPMLMFDRKFSRLGYGGGYYDKSIIKLKKYFQKEKKFFITIGLSYSEQEIDKIPYENHDMNLDYIVTEKEFLSRKSSTLN